VNGGSQRFRSKPSPIEPSRAIPGQCLLYFHASADPGQLKSTLEIRLSLHKNTNERQERNRNIRRERVVMCQSCLCNGASFQLFVRNRFNGQCQRQGPMGGIASGSHPAKLAINRLHRLAVSHLAHTLEDSRRDAACIKAFAIKPVPISTQDIVGVEASTFVQAPGKLEGHGGRPSIPVALEEPLPGGTHTVGDGHLEDCTSCRGIMSP